MDRLACVDVPALPLQLLVQRNPAWRGEAAAVVEHDAPHGVLLWTNERARREGVLPGLRYSAALALCTQLRAGQVAAQEIDEGVARLAELLRRFSPNVEPSRDEPGVFWLDVSGLERLHPSHVAWARALRAETLRAGFESAVSVGFRRFSSYAVAKALHGARVVVFADAAEEDALARRVPLRRIAVAPAARDDLEKLGVHTLGEFLRLPAESVFLRFGPELHRLHRLASGELVTPLEPRFALETPRAAIDLDHPAANLEQILFVVEELARPLLAELARREQGVKELHLDLRLEDHSSVSAQVQPARATLDFAQLARLLRLRCEHVKLARSAERIELELVPAPVDAEQLRLFALLPGRNPQAATQAFAALRAAFGADVVVRATLRSAHLPEASFAYTVPEHFFPASPRGAGVVPREFGQAGEQRSGTVRRIYAKPIQLPSRSRHEEDGWMLRGIAHGPVVQLHGPYFVSGGWWRTRVERDYYFAEMQSGEVLWIYFDRQRRRWFLQGGVA